MKNYGTNWNNIDLDLPCERALDIIDPLSFDDLLLEINCNIQNINEKTVREQFEADLQNRIQSAREVFDLNLKNIVKYANNYREELDMSAV